MAAVVFQHDATGVRCDMTGASMKSLSELPNRFYDLGNENVLASANKQSATQECARCASLRSGSVM